MPNCTNPCVVYVDLCKGLGTQLNDGTQNGVGNNRPWNMLGRVCSGMFVFICPISAASSGEGGKSGQPTGGGSSEQLPLWGRLISEVFNDLNAANNERDIFALLKEYRQMKEAFGAVRLDVGGDTYIGTNLARSNPEIPGTVQDFVKHAEGDAFA